MSQPYPLPRETRSTGQLAFNGSDQVYGPFDFKIFDIEDVAVYLKHDGEDAYTKTAAATVTKTSGLDYDTFSVDFGTVHPATSTYVVRGERTPQRSIAVTKGGGINTSALEKDLTKLAAEDQELRRDVDRSLRYDVGFAGGVVPKLAAGHFFKTDENGNFVDGGDATDIINAQTYAAQAEAAKTLAEAAAATTAVVTATSVAALLGLNTVGRSIGIVSGNAPQVYRYDASDLSSVLTPSSHTTTAVNSGTGTFTLADHGLKTGDAVFPTASVNGLTAETFYFVIAQTVTAIRYDAESSAFMQGQTLTGGTSGATATIAKVVDNGTAGVLWLSGISGTFVNNETITDGAGGSATANGPVENIFDTDAFQLAASMKNAIAGTAVSLTGTTNLTFKKHIDPLGALYATPAGAAIDGSEGAWVLQRLAGQLPASAFGAVAGASNDEVATAINCALRAAEALAPCMVLLDGPSFTLGFPVRCYASRVGLVGSGPYTCEIFGTWADGDIIHFNGMMNAQNAITEIFLQGFRVDTTTTMTAGKALHLENVARFVVRDVVPSGQDGSGNIYDGLHLDKVDAGTVDGIEVFALNSGIIANGSWPGAVHPRGSNVTIAGRKISTEGAGIVFGGDCGGLIVNAIDINNCDDGGIIIDQSQVIAGAGNRQIFLNPGCLIDGESVGGVRQQDGIIYDDPDLEDVRLNGVWRAVHKHGMWIKQASSSKTRIWDVGGNNIKCDNDAVRIDAVPRLFWLSDTDVNEISGKGVNATVDCTNLGYGDGVFILPNNRFRQITGGVATWDKIGVLPGTSFAVAIDDDAVFKFKPRDFTTLGAQGILHVMRANSAHNAQIYYRTDSGGAAVADRGITGDIVIGTGALAAGTSGGTDARLNINAHNDDMIYIKNRLGAQVTIYVTVVSAVPGFTA